MNVDEQIDLIEKTINKIIIILDDTFHDIAKNGQEKYVLCSHTLSKVISLIIDTVVVDEQRHSKIKLLEYFHKESLDFLLYLIEKEESKA